MKTRRAAVALVFVMVLSGFGIGKATAGDGTVQVRIPRCEEDERFLKGKGDFEGGRWTRYVCIHQDSFTP